MKQLSCCCFLAACLLLFRAPVYASETVSLVASDGLTVTADVYVPYGNDTTPVIVLFHQAGWSRGEYTEIAPWLNSLGYNCIAVDQRSGEYVRGVENETAGRADRDNRPTRYIDALPDIRAALVYAREHHGKSGVIAWGSSYSAALVLKLVAEEPGLADGVLAFSPGEYFTGAGKPSTWIQDSAGNLRVPVFITSSAGETGEWTGIFAAIPAGQKVSFVPESAGRHGSRALWNKYPDSGAYRKAVRNFLERYFPVAE